MVAEPRLTWHAGSILPFTSLWHIVHRLAALNALRCRELPFAADVGCIAPRTRHYNLLFNEPRFSGGHSPAEALSVNTLAALLGESREVFTWSHLGWIPRSSRCLLHPFVRLCPTCLAAGYHSALFSLRLLDSCPIHHCEFMSACLCGRRFGSEVDRLGTFNAGYCICGRTSFFTRGTCRCPTMNAEETRPMLDIAAWLVEISTVSRPVPRHAQLRQAHNRVFLSSLTSWCKALNISYPDWLPPIGERASFCLTEAPLSLGSLPHSPALRLREPRALPKAVARRATLWRDNEATTVYRSMTRHIRKHVARGAEPFAIEFMIKPNPLEMARTMQGNRQAMVAFAELLFHQCMERFAMRRRWPYRSPHIDGGRLQDHLEEPAIEAGHEEAQGLSPEAKTWVTRQAAAAMVTHAWRRAQGIALAAVRNGIADWQSANEVYFSTLSFPRPGEPLCNWYSAPPPFQVTWATSFAGGRLRFVSSPATSRIDWTLSATSKSTRVQAWLVADSKRKAEVDAACRGPSLTWTLGEGWQVLEAAHPGVSGVKRHRLLGLKLPGAKFWLFTADGRFVARSCESKIQAFGATPREAINGLRTAMRQHRRQYGPGETIAQIPEISTTPCRLDLERELDMLVMQSLYSCGFWNGAWRFNSVAVAYLNKDRRLAVEGRSQALP